MSEAVGKVLLSLLGSAWYPLIDGLPAAAAICFIDRTWFRQANGTLLWPAVVGTLVAVSYFLGTWFILLGAVMLRKSTRKRLDRMASSLAQAFSFTLGAAVLAISELNGIVAHRAAPLSIAMLLTFFTGAALAWLAYVFIRILVTQEESGGTAS